jgi:hypothetical protein
MSDFVSRYCAATEAGDLDAMMTTFTDDVEVVSPISGRMIFRGRYDAGHVLRAVYGGTLRDLKWRETLGEGSQRVVLADTKVLGVRMTDAMVFELAPDGRIRRVSPHLRPWLALTLFALVLGPKVARRPGVVRRALRG